MKGQHSQHWLTQNLADHVASSPGLGVERLSVSLLPRTADPRPELAQELAKAEALQQLTAICNSFAAVATPDQVLLPITTWKARDLIQSRCDLCVSGSAACSM